MNRLLILFLCLFFASCGTSKKYVHESEIERSTITNVASFKKTIEKADTIVRIPKDSVVLVRPLEDLLQGKPIEARDGGNTVRVLYDKQTGNVQATGITEEREIPVQVERTTEEQTKTDEVEKSKEAISEEKKEVERSIAPMWTGILSALLVFCIGILALALAYRRPRDGL